ncbi:glycosyltransferase family 4 protein [Myxococcota bacterium]|nr:glycosyltransferase family 4 protein [Myxococcota bacterium]
MRVLVVSNLYPPHYLGGYELLCGQVCEGLRARGHEVTVLTSRHGVEPGSPPEPGIHRALELVSPFHEPAVMARRVRMRVGRANESVARDLMLRLRPDLVFIWSQLRITLGAARAANRMGLATAFTFNDEHPLIFVPRRPSWRIRRITGALLDATLYRELFLHHLDLSHVTCISRHLLDRLVAGGLPVGHARVIHQSIALEDFPPRPDPGSLQDPPRLLFVGQLLHYKGVHLLLEAVRRLVAQGLEVRLTLAGSGDEGYEQRLRNEARPLGDRVTFLGRVPREDLPAIYRAHDLFLFPSTAVEGFGLTFLEAMASGIPVVATDSGGHGEVIRHDINAHVFPEGDGEALAAGIRRLLDDAELRRRLARQALQEVRRRFHFDRYLDEIEDFLEEAARQGPRRSR